MANATEPPTQDFPGDEFANNLFSDLAPLLTLFGEQVTKQFLSESLSPLDNIIFALLPLGILTAVVSAIRISGSPSLRAFIGRAQESVAAAEIELLSCTSETVAELWNGGIARVFGRPRIIEFAAWEADIAGKRSPRISPIEKAEEVWVRKTRIRPEANQKTSPNLSLNIGIKRLRKEWFVSVFLFGAVLQCGEFSKTPSTCANPLC